MSIGAEVLAARENAGLSLAEVSSRTRIRATVIGEIESDDFRHCGGDIYARGHLRAIATAVGVDPKPWVDAYDAEYGTVTPSATEVFDSETSATPVRRRGANWSAVMAAALVVAVGLVAVQIVSSSGDSSRTTTTVAEPSPTPTDSGDGEPTDKPTQVAEAEPDGVTVRMTALPGQLSWVSVTRSDGGVLYEGFMRNGQSKTFRDERRISVLSGCASAVELTVNGTDVGVPGSTCSPETVRFTPKDPDGAAG
ncbi:MAG: RodZ domain-containing protein [Actinomycetes bacterium]